MMYPLVSIVMPTYNRAELLPRAIASVQRQQYRQWELLIVDDGSVDHTKEVVEYYRQKDSRIQYRRQENVGQAAARSRGQMSARGSYITFLDSDDEYLPSHLLLRVAEMIQHPHVEFIHGGVIVIGSPEKQYVPDLYNPRHNVPVTECVIGGTFFARAGVIERAGGWQGFYGEDNLLFERIRRCAAIKRVPYPTYCYHRDTLDSICSTYPQAVKRA